MRRFCLTVILALAILGCRKEETPTSPPPPPPPPPPSLGGNPEIVEKVATNQGADLKLTWKSVEGAYGYRVYCDGNKIWEGRDTTYTIQGSSNICRTVEVSAYAGSDEMKTYIDLTPKSSIITGLVTHYGIGNSWVKLDLPNGTAISTTQSNVDPYAPNTGWFVFYNTGSYNVQFRDASATSVGTAKMVVAFTAPSSGNLAPGPGNYDVVMRTAANAYHFFWADNTITGYGDMDNYDYFGVIKVLSISGSGPYTANLEIYIQYRVPGLRWVKLY
ncbi:MAG: hypothetical protein ACO2O5_01635 [Candidatus Caldipriscus sp.]